MEIVTGTLLNVVAKLGEQLIGEYNLQKEVKGEIRFLRSELKSMHGTLEKVSNTPIDELDIQDKIWAMELRELSYNIEDNIDTFMVHIMGNEQANLHGIKKFIDRSVGLFRKAKISHGIATEVRGIKRRVEEVAKRHDRYKISSAVAKRVKIDPRLLTRYMEVTELVGIDEARDELIKTLEEENEVSMQHNGKIVSVVGFGGLGKFTLANAVYEKIRAQFDCCAFVSVSQTLDSKKLLKGLLSNLGKNTDEETLDEEVLIGVLREFLQEKRYFVVIDDIWDISVWKMIRCALPDNNVGYTIITTTRKSDVAELADVPYKLRPLSLNNSRKLLYQRIFGKQNKHNSEEEEKCPDQELAKVSDKILKKCAGVPLAIITMASLLACKARNKLEWYEVYNSIGTGMENNLDVKNMRKILSFSYYDLPRHLRTCLLYLSMFPEDFEINKDQLIKMWVAEGFIQSEKPGKSLFELGESYLNELVNRSMIQPIYDSYSDIIVYCRIHDMVLDLVRSLSSDENFVTIVNNMDQAYPQNIVRRLSIQNGKENHVMAQDTWSLQHARSIVVFPSTVAQVQVPGTCRVLRVLELKGCNLSQSNSLKNLGNLYHLRYLGLRGTRITELPEEIGNLQFLQILNVWNNNIFSLPSSVVQLRNLMCLYIDVTTKVPNGIGNLSCLQQLSCIGIDGSTINIIEELGKLTKLRVLRIELNDIQLNGELDTWVAPRHLRVLCIRGSCMFSTLPAWVNPSLLLDITSLQIRVMKVHQANLEILGRLPALRYLDLEVDNKNLGIHQGFVLGAGSFPCLVLCWLHSFIWPVVFQQAAMPRLRVLWLTPFHVLEAKGIASSDGGLDLGLGNLPSLQMIKTDLQFEGASREEAEKVKDALRHAAEIHPNHPRHEISIH